MYTGSTKGTKKDFLDILSDARMKEGDMLVCVRRGLWEFGSQQAENKPERKTCKDVKSVRQVHGLVLLEDSSGAHGNSYHSV